MARYKYRALANVMTKAGQQDFMKDRLYSESEVSVLDKDYVAKKFEKVKVVISQEYEEISEEPKGKAVTTDIGGQPSPEPEKEIRKPAPNPSRKR